MSKKETYTYDECFEQVRAMDRILDLMFYHFANLAVEQMGEKKGKELVAESVKRFGLERAERVKRGVEEMGLEPVLSNYGKVLDLPIPKMLGMA